MYRQAQHQHYGSGGPSICGRCGATAPQGDPQCMSCGANLSATRRTVNAGSRPWVRVTATFRCRACAFDSPFDGVELDSGINCAQCGTFQRINTSGWGRCLRFAHDVADLAGPNPEGHAPHHLLWIGDDNPYAELGLSRTSLEQEIPDDNRDGALPKFTVGPGQPVCTRCEVPLNVEVRNRRSLTSCPQCGVHTEYALDQGAHDAYGSLLAIVGAEHVIGRPRANMSTQAGAVAIGCPQCGAPLPPTRVGVAECGHCRAASYVPARARQREKSQLATPEAFFLTFNGPSAKRAELEQPTKPVADAKANASAIFSRGITALPGIELPKKRGGLDTKQLAFLLGSTAIALAIGGALSLGMANALDLGSIAEMFRPTLE